MSLYDTVVYIGNAGGGTCRTIPNVGRCIVFWRSWHWSPTHCDEPTPVRTGETAVTFDTIAAVALRTNADDSLYDIA